MFILSIIRNMKLKPSTFSAKIRAFTLLELLGVIAVVAVLASVAIQSTRGSIGASQEGAVRRQAQVLNSAYQTYIAAGGALSALAATDRETMKTQSRTAVTTLLGTINTSYGVVGPFLPTTPTDNWYVGATYMGGPVADTTHFIGFSTSTGFAYLGAD